MVLLAIFDVDGTLVDSNDLHVEAWRLAFARFGKQVTREAVRSQLGKGGDQLMPVFLTAEELCRFGDDLERYRADLFVREFLPLVEPFPGVRQLLRRLRADDVRIVLASSAKSAELQRHVTKMQIEDLVDATVCADDAEHSKPCPDIFRAALEKVPGVPASEAVVVGDSPYDAQAATRLGVRTIGVLSGGFSVAALRANGAVAVYRDVAELAERYAESLFGRRR